MVAGAVLVVLALAGAGAGLAVSLGSSSSTHASALEQAVMQANQSVKAVGMFPLSRCSDKVLQGGIEQLSCPNVWHDVSAVVYHYPSLTSLYAEYHSDFAAFHLNDGSKLTANSSNCIGSGATGEAAWRHPPYPVQTTKLDPTMPASMAKAGWEGRVFCGQSNTQPFQFEWTFDPGLILGIATSLDHTDVWTWWHAIHHNLLIGSMSMGSQTQGGAMTPTTTPHTTGGSMPMQTTTGGK